MKIKKTFFKNLGLLLVTLSFGDKGQSTLTIAVNSDTDKMSGTYIGPKNGAGWVYANRLKKQFPVALVDEAPPF